MYRLLKDNHFLLKDRGRMRNMEHRIWNLKNERLFYSTITLFRKKSNGDTRLLYLFSPEEIYNDYPYMEIPKYLKRREE